MKVWQPQFENFIQNIHTHFHLDGFVNRQNCHVWSLENPRVINEKLTHNVSLFSADFGQKAPSEHIFLRMRLIK